MDNQKDQFGRNEIRMILDRLRDQAVHALMRHRDATARRGAHERPTCTSCAHWEGQAEGLRQAIIHFGGDGRG